MAEYLQFPVAEGQFEKAIADYRAAHAPVIGPEATEAAIREYRAFTEACSSFTASFQVEACPEEQRPLLVDAIRKTVMAMSIHLTDEYVRGVVQRLIVERERTPAGGA